MGFLLLLLVIGGFALAALLARGKRSPGVIRPHSAVQTYLPAKINQGPDMYSMVANPSTQPLQMIKSVSGRKFWEEGYETGVCEGMASSVPRWFVDLRSADKIRVNCLTQATIYLRNDGRLFHIQPAWEDFPQPLADALDGDRDAGAGFIDGVFKREKVSATSTLWECGEYIPGAECYEKENIWRVAAAARRTGRYLYTAKKKTAKAFLEDQSQDVPWIYAHGFDQFTDEYELRYQQKIRQVAAERLAREEYARANAHVIDFDLAGRNTRSYYECLDVSEDASPGQIKRAYWAKAKTCHPDLNPDDPAAIERFKQLSIAYAELMKIF
jgi:hypothetical protein